MFNNETEKALNDTIQLLCTEIRESIEKRGGSEPSLTDALANLVKATKN